MKEERTEDNEDENGMIISDKIHRVVFLGSQAVGKSSLIDQLMSSEHTNVYQDNVDDAEKNCEERLLKVCVNNQLMSVSVKEISEEEYANTETEAQCFVLVYAVDDEQSFGESQFGLLSQLLHQTVARWSLFRIFRCHVK